MMGLLSPDRLIEVPKVQVFFRTRAWAWAWTSYSFFFQALAFQYLVNVGRKLFWSVVSDEFISGQISDGI